MTGDSKKMVIDEMNSIYKEPKEIRLMSYKILVEKFNHKYEDLSQEQKAVLREYIGNVSNTNNLKLFLQKEAKRVKTILEQKSKKINDKTLKIKLSEVISLLETYDTIKTVDETHIS